MDKRTVIWTNLQVLTSPQSVEKGLRIQTEILQVNILFCCVSCV